MQVSLPKMVAQKTIQITNAIELSTPYMKRFFEKAGPIEQVVKDNINNIVYIVHIQVQLKQFQNSHSIQRALAFNGRVLDKKPILIKPHNASIQNINYEQKPFQSHIHSNLRPTRISIASVHQIPFLHQSQPSQCPKLPIRSEYRLIDHSDIQDHQLQYQHNTLEVISNKAQLWKVILNDLSRHVNQPDPNSKQLILSTALGIWGLIQLKLGQIRFIVQNNENEKSKYIENFIQETVINKLNSLENPNLINNSHKFKTISNQRIIKFSFSVSYPQQFQQEEKFFSESNDKTHKIITILYHFSPLIGKIYHQLHTNSLIMYETKHALKKIIDKFLDKPSQSLIDKGSTQSTNQEQKVDDQIELENQNNALKIDDNMKFIGFIQNYGSYLFQNLIPYQMNHHYNSILWLEVKSNKIQASYPYPGFFSCTSLFKNCKDKSLVQQVFFDLYTVQNKAIHKRQNYNFQNYVMVFQDAQFTLNHCIDNALNFLRFQFRNVIYQNQQLNQQKLSLQKNLSIDLDIFYVGINIKELEKLIVQTSIKLHDLAQKLAIKLASDYNTSKPKLTVNLCLMQILLEKQKQFNTFKCENYLISHIDRHFIGKNSIIPSQEFAQKLAQKLLQQAPANQIFGFRDKKYIGSQIWRLYNKSGARRAKLKISQYNLKKHKFE